MMIQILLAAGIALAIVATPIARAQTVGAAITFTTEERAAVRDWIKRQRPTAPRDPVIMGAILPDDVESYPVPPDWGPSVANYRYFYADNHVYFVDPSTRRVVLMVD